MKRKITKISILICYSLFISHYSFSQDTAAVKKDTLPKIKPDTAAAAAKDTTPKPLFTAFFDTTEFTLIEGEIVSKILRLQNNSGKEQSVRTAINYPGGWKLLTDVSKYYTLAPNDSIFIPVRIIPLGKIRGNTKYLINAFVINKDQVPMATAYFYAARPKSVNWDITISPFDKVYLMNDSTGAKFDINVLNIGNEEQALFMHISNYRKDVLLYDSTGRILKNTYREFNLKEQHDTSFHYRASILQGKRNFRTVDEMGYTIGFLNEAKRYTLFVNTSQSRILGTQGVQKMKKVDFVRLPNEMKVNPNSTFSLPLIAEANVGNLVTGQPVMNLMFSGYTTLDNGASINYFSQFFLSLYYADFSFLRNSTQYFGYYDKKWQIQLGSVGGIGGAIAAGGRGANAMYQINQHHSVGAFYTRAPYFFSKPDRESVGAVYAFNALRFRLMTSYSHLSNSGNVNYTSDYLGANSNYSFREGHSVTFGGYAVRNASSAPANPFVKWGFLAYGSYSGMFLKGKLQSSLSGNYISPYFTPFDKGDKITAAHSSHYMLNKQWNLHLNNNYNRNIYEPVLITSNQQKLRSINNTLTANTKVGENFLGGGVFYNFIRNNDTINMHSRGLTLNYSQAKYENNTFFSMGMQGGYSRLINAPNTRDYFFFQYFSLFRYHTFSGTIRYNYGTVSVLDKYYSDNGVYYQFLGASVNYQYQFRNPHWVLNDYLSYAYYNQFKRHSIGWTPEVLYFSKTGWRVRVTGGVYYSSSLANRGTIAIPGQTEEVPAPTRTHSYTTMLQVGVRKEFNIPFPWGSKKRFFSHTYIAFIDLNGNNKRDKNELLLDNVVVRTDEWEVLTDENGKAKLLNMAPGRYNFSAFSLIDLKGYFPNIEDSISVIKNDTIPVPFVKGVKVYGNVFVDREKLSPDAEIPVDLSGIHISASGVRNYSTLTSKDGTFELYVPFGKYTVTMDEKILGDRFTLLQNNIEITLDKKTESLFVTFLIVEKRRKLNIKKFGEPTGSAKDSASSNPVAPAGITWTGTDTVSSAKPLPGAIKVPGKNNLYYYMLPTGPGVTYRIQLASTSKRLTPSQIATQFKGVTNVKEYVEGGLYKYTAGDVNSVGEIKKLKNDLRTKGYKDAFIVPFKDNQRLQYK
ncbi:MAG: hypothetical protein HY063_14770 [Bacteroidetes bacterium]|nr:hypothetical protein [Bacteroidota bacterium]